MATSADVLGDALGRVRDLVGQTVDGLTREQLTARLDADANTIAWLVWHLTRVEDDHIAAVAGTEQCWTADGWCDRFALPLDRGDTGYGHTTEQVAAVVADAGLLAAYQDAAADMALGYVAGLTDDDLSAVVDERWDPPVTLGVRLVSVVCDGLEHVGQAAYVRGILERR